MRKIIHLSTCNTCQRIIGELNSGKEFDLQDVKDAPLNENQLDFLKNKVGSYEALFNRRARKYRSMGLKDQSLTEADYRRLILQEYTFLKRPVVIIDDEVYVGNAKKVVAAAKDKLAGV